MHAIHTEEYNPLFAKMQARFCVGGTIAEKLEKKAADYRKESPVKCFSEYHLAQTSCPTERSEKKKKPFSFKFSLRHVSTACMVLLIAGTFLFSGATLGHMLTDEAQGVDVFVSESAAKTPLLDGAAEEVVDPASLSDEV
ncbi:MAG: hypothetical protein J6W28_05240 [Clostridia bacterium]|nr:hypothetical protein [Clostridia bacterium]